jgi:hypothetical protein
MTTVAGKKHHALCLMRPLKPGSSVYRGKMCICHRLEQAEQAVIARAEECRPGYSDDDSAREQYNRMLDAMRGIEQTP